MRVISINVNGIRAAHRKNFFIWLQKQDADIVCVQETKAQVEQLIEEIIKPKGYYSYFNDALKKGYSGVAIYSRKEPDRVIEGLGWKAFDREGRWVQADYGRLSVVSVYMPSGTSGDERQDFKYRIMKKMKPLLKRFANGERDYILCGDFNIAHKEIDLKNWRGNRKNSGFLPDERAWLDWLFDDLGMVDVFRHLDDRSEQYTWWSNRGQAWAKNVGWRIDYQIATSGIAARAQQASIFTDDRFSDHAPLIIDYKTSTRWLNG